MIHIVKTMGAALLLLVLASAIAGEPSQITTARRAWVRSIAFEGLHRFKPEHLVASTGLKIGEPIDVSGVKAASRKLIDTGLFKSVKDKYLVVNDQVDVTFIVEEGARTHPVEFDNFLWFSERELRQAIALEVPFFDGEAPETGTVNESIAGALQSLLKAKGIQGRVEQMPRLDSGSVSGSVFSVKGVRMPICSLTFPGAVAVPEAELLKGAKALLDVDYSRSQVDAFAQLTLLPIYANHGHLRASFRSAAAELQNAPGCDGGVAVTLPVVEGPAYTVAAVEWPGEVPLSRGDLEERLGVRPGDPADPEKLRTGLDSIRRKLEEIGFLRAKTKATATLDDTNARVTWRVVIDAGSRYRMGVFDIEGLPAEETGRLRKMWELKTGDLFESDYVRRYLGQVVASPGGIPPGRRSIGAKVKPNHETQTVDVTLVFNAGSGAGP